MSNTEWRAKLVNFFYIYILLRPSVEIFEYYRAD